MPDLVALLAPEYKSQLTQTQTQEHAHVALENPCLGEAAYTNTFRLKCQTSPDREGRSFKIEEDFENFE
jgi:hypothetical protein